MNTAFWRIEGTEGTDRRDRTGCPQPCHNWLNLIRLPVRPLQNDWSTNKKPCLSSFWPQEDTADCDIRDYQECGNTERSMASVLCRSNQLPVNLVGLRTMQECERPSYISL